MDGLFLEYRRDLAICLLTRKAGFLGYLATAFVFAIAVQTYAFAMQSKAVAAVLSRKVWFSRSAVADYKITNNHGDGIGTSDYQVGFGDGAFRKSSPLARWASNPIS